MRIKRRTLIIGLGGTGCFSLRYVKQNLQEAGILPYSPPGLNSKFDQDATIEQIKNVPIRFVPIDLDELSRTANIGANIDDEFIYLEKQKVEQKVKYMNFSENAVYWSWYPEKESRLIKMRQAQEGAGQWRPLGRLAYCENQALIEQRINDSLKELTGLGYDEQEMDGKDIDVYLLSSVAGGTGSGLLIDVAYFLQKSRVLKDENLRITTNAFLLLPDIFASTETGGRTQANSYATLKELKGFYQQECDFEMVYPQRLEHIKVEAGKAIPFSNIYLIDKDLHDRQLLSPEECYQYTGNVVYLKTVSSIGNQARSIFANERIPPKEKGSKLTLSESGYVFSSCSGIIVEFPDEAKIADIFIESFSGSTEKVEGELVNQKVNEHLDNWEKDINKILQGASASGISALWEEVKEKIRSQVNLYKKEDKNLEFLKEELTNCADLIQESITWRIQELAEKLIKTTHIQAVRQRFSAEPTLLTPSFLLQLLQLTKTAIDKAVESPEQISQLEELISPITELQNKIRGGIDKIKKNQSQSKKPFRHRYFVNEAIALNLTNLKGHIKELEEMLVSESSRIPELGTSLKTIFTVQLKDALNKGVQFLSRNIDQLKTSSEQFQNELRAFSTGFKSQEKEQKKHINKFLVSKTAILHSLKNQKPEQSYNIMLNNTLFCRDFWQECEQSIFEPIEINKKPDPGDFLQEFRYQIAHLFENGQIEVDFEQYYKELFNLLSNAKTAVFKNLKINPCEASMVFCSIPEYSGGRKYLFRDRTHANEVEERIKIEMQKVFPGTPCEISHTDDYSFIIYYETHHHPSENISGIREYRRAYHNINFETKFLHIHKKYAEQFGDLISTELQTIYCGNSGCNFNISNLPRYVYTCPDCDHPILNRCGNDCDVDNLLERIGGLEQLDKDKIICPGCNNRIRTYWWECERHGAQWREKGEDFCPDCTLEADKEIIGFSERNIKVDERRYAFYCTHCKEEEKKSPYVIPLPELYYEVPKYKSPLLEKKLQEEGIQNNQCPTCNAQLFPICPHKNEKGGPWHYVISDSSDKLFCGNINAHKEKIVDIYQCKHCHYPVKNDSVKCPRCFNELVHCNHCSSDKGFLIPTDQLLEGNRCPICKYTIQDSDE